MTDLDVAESVGVGEQHGRTKRPLTAMERRERAATIIGMVLSLISIVIVFLL